LKASICTTDFDKLIKTNTTATCGGITNDLTINQRVADVWKEINDVKIDPVIFVESADLMKKKLAKAFDKFGREKVPYVGPECGLKGFPTYQSALECLKRVSKATKSAIIT
jgi:methionine synthase II (cobalamin-independent)